MHCPFCKAEQVLVECHGSDSNGDGSVSNSELPSALAQTGSNPGNAATQSLLTMMDTNGDKSVGSSEFLKFETAFVAAEKSPG
jgi:Ca2+-binding EF-hand superfamily protein